MGDTNKICSIKIMKTHILLITLFLLSVSSQAEEVASSPFDSAIEGIKNADRNRDGKLDTKELGTWESNQRGDTRASYHNSGYIKQTDIFEIFDSDGDGLLSFDEIKVYETTWTSEDRRILRGRYIGEGKNGASIQIEDEKGTAIDIPLQRLEIRSQMRGSMNILANLNSGQALRGRELFESRIKRFTDNPNNLFFLMDRVDAGPGETGWNNEVGNGWAKQPISDESFKMWLALVIDMNRKAKDLAVLANRNYKLFYPLKSVGTPQQNEVLIKTLDEFWKSQIEMDDQSAHVYLNACCFYNLREVRDAKIERHAEAAHRGLKFHPKYLPLLEFASAFAGLPEGVQYDYKNRLKIEQTGGGQPATRPVSK